MCVHNGVHVYGRREVVRVVDARVLDRPRLQLAGGAFDSSFTCKVHAHASSSKQRHKITAIQLDTNGKIQRLRSQGLFLLCRPIVSTYTDRRPSIEFRRPDTAAESVVLAPET